MLLPTSGGLESLLAEELFADMHSSSPIPVILILGPPGCGKGTVSKRLAADFNLYHLSTGDWLRSQARPPIAGVSDRINGYVFAKEPIPDDVLTAEYSSEDQIPPPLLLYNCTKRGVSTPSEMWLRALPALKQEFAAIAAMSPRPNGILLDNFPKTINHAKAAAQVFGPAFPSLAISIECPEEVACARFLARGRGSDDEAVFRRRFVRSARETPAVIDYYQRNTCVVKANALGEPTAAYETLVSALKDTAEWRGIASRTRNLTFKNPVGSCRLGNGDSVVVAMAESFAAAA